MPRTRTNNTELPRGMYKTPGGTYYCYDSRGEYCGLGRDYHRAFSKFGDVTKPGGNTWTVGRMLDGYLGLLPEFRNPGPVRRSDELAPATHKKNIKNARNLRIFFNGMHPADVTQPHIYKYMAERGRPVAANRDKALLSSAFTWGVSIGIPGLERNPCYGVRRIPERPKRTKVTDSMFIQAYETPYCPPVVRCIMDIMDMFGLRPSDALRLNDREHCTAAGVTVTPGKTAETTGKANEFPWTQDMRELRERCRALAREGVTSLHWICTRDGQPMTYDGLASLWQRFIRKAVADGYVETRFRLYDLRGRAGDRSERAGQEGNKLLANDRKTFERHYKSSPTVVRANPPTRSK